MYVLDTDILSILQRPESAGARTVQSRLAEVSLEEIATTIVSYEEQTRGWFGVLAKASTLAAQVAAYARLDQHLESFRNLYVLSFDDRAAIQFQQLRSLRVRIGVMDMKIAAIALVHGATLITRNAREFRLIPALMIENWAD